MTQTIAQLSPAVQARVQDPTAIFWNLNYEFYAACAESISDLMLLVGRPTITVNQLVTLQPGTVWQKMPPGMLAITNLRTSSYSLWKTSLHDMDYTMASWGPDWESDVTAPGYPPQPLRWGPLGVSTYFFVHPAPSVAIQVLATGVSYPITDSWPPTGAETSPFHDEFNVALELYAAAYMRYKDRGDDALEGDKLFKAYLDIAARMTQIDDRQDSLVFSHSFGVPTTASQVSGRW